MLCEQKYSSLLEVCVAISLSLLVMEISGIQPPVMPNLEHLNLRPKIENLNKVPLKGKPVPPCIACRNLVKSFLTAVEKTTRQSFAGGDADWERQKLGTYENSELRFIEIQEMLCADVELGKDQCYNLAEHHESELEDWFYEKRKKNVDLYESLCIHHIKVCCPNNMYGPHCIPCPGGVDKPCAGHGKCRKGGTREEPAECVCDAGYAGEVCDACDRGYYPEPVGPDVSCQKCNEACRGHCRGPGPKDCEVCSPGYHFLPDAGCTVDSSLQPETSVGNEEKSDGQTSAQVNSSDESAKNDGTVKLDAAVEDSNLRHTEF